MLSKTPALPFFEVIVNNAYIKNYAKRVEIIQQVNAHPVVLLDVEYIGVKTAQGSTGVRNSWKYIAEQTPITINYGMKPNYMAQFVGYIASYKLLKSGDDLAHNGLITTCVQYTIVGASQIMQSTHNRAWKHTSPTTIISDIATQNGFRSITHPYRAAIDYRLQNMSDFRFINSLADEIGYRFYVDNTDLYFVDPKVILNRSNIRNIPQFWVYNKPGLWDTLRSFQPITGTITPDGGIVANRTVSGININTGQTLTTANSYQLFTAPNTTAINPTITKYFTSSPADSSYEAQQKITADTNANIYWLTADCTLRGDFRVKPNMLVEFMGAALPVTEQGVWLVQSASHILTMPAPSGPKVDATYIINAQVIRDQYYAATTTSVNELTQVAQTVPPVLIGGVWRSSNVGAQIFAK